MYEKAWKKTKNALVKTTSICHLRGCFYTIRLFFSAKCIFQHSDCGDYFWDSSLHFSVIFVEYRWRHVTLHWSYNSFLFWTRRIHYKASFFKNHSKRLTNEKIMPKSYQFFNNETFWQQAISRLYSNIESKLLNNTNLNNIKILLLI